ncbi:uncharacterized protein LOC117640235 isoform X1 [Thrips palmi]|uniref:Uncharacterized protein LOC117640235 isoform X1 n=1 Tax=Thrips palmi TaxID=161013 RepID=A0A6P8YF14_THRPL|nr:uncharacterized protein LOC117640235 isoform X1 [Thrips palmi]
MDKTPSSADEEAALTDQMDNAAFERDANGASQASQFGAATTVEMGEFGAVPLPAVPGSRTSPSYAARAASGAPLCKPDLCRAMGAMAPGLAKSPGLRPNPWHRNKTILLVATIAGLVIWAVAYFALQKTGIL